MKTLTFSSILTLGFVVSAQASTPPIGKFDCSLKKGSLRVEISQPDRSFYYAKVHHTSPKEENEVEGPLLVALHKSSGKSFQLLRLPGSNAEFFFDENGNLGLEREKLDCRKM